MMLDDEQFQKRRETIHTRLIESDSETDGEDDKSDTVSTRSNFTLS